MKLVMRYCCCCRHCRRASDGVFSSPSSACSALLSCWSQVLPAHIPPSSSRSPQHPRPQSLISESRGSPRSINSTTVSPLRLDNTLTYTIYKSLVFKGLTPSLGLDTELHICITTNPIQEFPPPHPPQRNNSV